MYGAILGDIIGSPFEFDRGDKTKEFDLFSKGCRFTDDSVMTIAIGEALLAVGTEATGKEIEVAVAANMQDWGRRYPHAGYGGRFRCWLSERNPKPYGSYGNGSAMRVSGRYDRTTVPRIQYRGLRFGDYLLLRRIDFYADACHQTFNQKGTLFASGQVALPAAVVVAGVAAVAVV